MVSYSDLEHDRLNILKLDTTNNYSHPLAGAAALNGD